MNSSFKYLLLWFGNHHHKQLQTIEKLARLKVIFITVDKVFKTVDNVFITVVDLEIVGLLNC